MKTKLKTGWALNKLHSENSFLCWTVSVKYLNCSRIMPTADLTVWTMNECNIEYYACDPA